MCGIVGAVAQRNVGKILIEGLHRLEYRGYDSAGLAIIDADNKLNLAKEQGKVSILETSFKQRQFDGHCGIAHTRWATHGIPSKTNSHPHCSDHIAVVHNGIIENYRELGVKLKHRGYSLVSETDTEVIPHLIHSYYKGDLLAACQQAITKLKGAFAIAIISSKHPNHLIATRKSSPLLLGKGIEEMFVASDTLALKQVTDQFMYLDDGDLVHLKPDGSVDCIDANNKAKQLSFQIEEDKYDSKDKGEYRHYMDKEIRQQPAVVKATSEGYLNFDHINIQQIGIAGMDMLKQAKAVQIVACGSSFYAASVARIWIEEWANIPCRVEIASEFIYRSNYVPSQCVLLLISQSGETADTLTALRKSKKMGYLGSMAICNVPNSSLVREVNACFLTKAGFEVSVASTKAFVTQLVALQILAIGIADIQGLSTEKHKQLAQDLAQLPTILEQTLELQPKIEKFAQHFVHEHNMLFLGRGSNFPIACEGALKMKEITYIHAEAYAAGELKHGPLALIDEHMPVLAISPNDGLIEKLKSNLKEVEARDGKLYLITDDASISGIDAIVMPKIPESIIPIAYTLPLQMLAYQVAVIRGNDVDQPRNLAKSVTVE